MVFSEPLSKYHIEDANIFFRPKDSCMDCDNKHTHFCYLDLEIQKFTNRHDLDDLVISKDIILQILPNTEPTAACGPDEIPAILLKNFATGLAEPITMLWQKLFNKGKYPL